MVLQVEQWKTDNMSSSKAGKSKRASAKNFSSQMVAAVERVEDAPGKKEILKRKEEPKDSQDFMQMILDKISDLYVKLQNGEAVPSFQIGVRSFTLEEWEEFLEQFDSVEEAVRKMTEEERREQEEKAIMHVL